MRQSAIIASIIAGILVSACTSKSPDFVASIPDNAFAVVSMHPMQIHTKGKLNTLQALKEKAKDEIWSQILEDPLSTGVMVDEYAFLFAWMEEEAPVMGMVAGMKDLEKFETTMGRIEEGIMEGASEGEGYKYIRPGDEGIVAWNETQVIILGSPDFTEFENSYWTEKLDWMFNPVKEESIVSLVDFKDFQDEMKDINLWFSADDMAKIIKKVAESKGKAEIGELPVKLTNNYTHLYCDFANGAMNISGETNFSEEVQKNIDEVLVMNPSLNQEILKITPGGDLLLALSLSMDLEKVQSMIEKISPEETDGVGSKLEEVTGIPPDQMLQALSGDFTLAVNGLDEEAMIPLEIFIGLGVKSDEIQKKLMEQVGSMVPVKEDGDFFMINVQGNEIYSGIIHDTWVITNVKGYKDAVEGNGLDQSLLDSRFKDFSDGSVGMYMNLDLGSYPELVQGLLAQQEEKGEWVGQLTEPFDYMGFSAGDQQGQMILKTNSPNENSLYTILKLTESGE
jgi:hypothetical protein